MKYTVIPKFGAYQLIDAENAEEAVRIAKERCPDEEWRAVISGDIEKRYKDLEDKIRGYKIRKIEGGMYLDQNEIDLQGWCVERAMMLDIPNLSTTMSHAEFFHDYVIGKHAECKDIHRKISELENVISPAIESKREGELYQWQCVHCRCIFVVDKKGEKEELVYDNHGVPWNSERTTICPKCKENLSDTMQPSSKRDPYIGV